MDIGGDGETRFSGDDSSAKLCNGGDVSELTPDFEPTETKQLQFLLKLILIGGRKKSP